MDGVPTNRGCISFRYFQEKGREASRERISIISMIPDWRRRCGDGNLEHVLPNSNVNTAD